jgi:phospholipid/cholesterol/gamma-HCH transport system permease protein
MQTGDPRSDVGHVDEDAKAPSEPTPLDAIVGIAQSGRQLWRLLADTLYYAFRGRHEPGAVVEQMYQIGNRSLVFLCIVMGFVGMILTYQAGVQTLRVIPDLSRLGATFIELVVKDLAPSICALMLATRVGAGIAAEIGSMVVTEQIDALKMCSADPVDYLVKPRFIASVIMTLMLVVLAASVSFLTATLTAQAYFGISPRTFLSFNMVGTPDIVVGITKCVAYGAAIPVISAHAGLSTSGGSEGVGLAATRAVVNSSLAVVIMNFFISGAGYVVFGE